LPLQSFLKPLAAAPIYLWPTGCSSSTSIGQLRTPRFILTRLYTGLCAEDGAGRFEESTAKPVYMPMNKNIIAGFAANLTMNVVLPNKNHFS